MRKRKLLTLMLLLTVYGGQAHLRSDSLMRAIASSQLSRTAGVKAQYVKSPQQLHCVLDKEALAVYEPTQSDGFVVVARNDEVEPVLAYGTGRFEPDALPENVKWWLASVQQRLSATDVEVPRRNVRFTPVENFITTIWGQDAPFNKLTPRQAPCGCVATALAQAMNYRKHPASAQFEEEYYVITDTVIAYSAQVNSTYSWNYADSYVGASPRHGNAVAQLLADCGYATCMQYAASGSGTYNFMAARALTYYFDYPEESVKSLSRAYAPDEEFFQIIYDELAEQSPVIFGGSDENFGGHSFVLSGVDDDGLVWVNWGWDGEYNGYYAIDLMNSPNGYFTDGQDIVYGIRTTLLPTDQIEGRVCMYGSKPYLFTYEPYVSLDEGINVEKCIQIALPGGIINENATDMVGQFGLFGTDLTDGQAWVVAQTDRDTIYCASGFVGNGLMFYYDVSDLQTEHTYRMSFGVRDDRDSQWRSIRCKGGEIAYDVTVHADGTATISEAIYKGTASNITPLSSGQLGRAKHTDVYDLQGRLIYTAPTAQFNFNNVPIHGTLIVRQGDKVRKVLK